MARWLLLPLALAGPLAARAEGLRLYADWLQVTRNRLLAQGRVRLELGRCSLSACDLDLIPGRVLSGQQVRLDLGQARLQAQRLTLKLDPDDPGDLLSALWVSGTPCACPRGEPLLTLHAYRLRIPADARRVFLTWPALRVLGRRVLPLPLLVLPLVPGVSGLLLPELGYSGRDGVRIRQAVYLAPGEAMDLLLEGGWVQGRGGLARTRLRAWQDGRGEGELEVTALLSPDQSRGTFQGSGAIHNLSQTLAAGARLDLATDHPAAIDQEPDLQRILARYLRTRVWAHAGHGPWFGEATADLIQELEAPPTWEEALQSRSAAWLGALPFRVAGPLLAELSAGVVHWTAAAAAGFVDENGNRRLDPGERLLRAAALSLLPALTAAGAAGPFRLAARASYELYALAHPAGLAPEPGSSLSWSWTVLHTARVLAEGALPLSRTFSSGPSLRLAHEVEPFLGLQWGGGSGSAVVVPDATRVRQGGYAVAGARTQLASRSGSGPPRAPLLAEARIMWPLLSEKVERLVDPEPLLGGSLQLRPMGPLSGGATALWAAQSQELTEAGAEVCGSAPNVRLKACTGYWRLRIQQAQQLWGPWGSPWLAGGSRSLPLSLSADQIYGTARFTWGAWDLELFLAGDPLQGLLTHGWGSLGLTFGCGCYRLSLSGRGWQGQSWPDLMARFTLLPAGLDPTRCSLRRR